MRKENESEKKPYMKPEAHRFSLRPAEAVLGFCKTATGHGANAQSMGNCRVPGACSTIGS